MVSAGEEHGDSAAADGLDDCERVVEFQRLAPIQKLDGIEASVAAKRLVDGRPGLSQPGRKRSNGQPEFRGPGPNDSRKGLVAALL